MWIFSFPRIYCRGHLFLMYIPATFIKDQLIVNIWIYFWGLYFVSLFYMSVFILLPYCFDYYALQYSLKLWSMMSSAVLFVLKMALDILGLFCFHINFRISFSIFCENYSWNFDTDCIKYVDFFVYYGHFNNINLFNQLTWAIFLFICVFFKFFHQYFIVFSVQIFHILG